MAAPTCGRPARQEARHAPASSPCHRAPCVCAAAAARSDGITEAACHKSSCPKNCGLLLLVPTVYSLILHQQPEPVGLHVEVAEVGVHKLCRVGRNLLGLQVARGASPHSLAVQLGRQVAAVQRSTALALPVSAAQSSLSHTHTWTDRRSVWQLPPRWLHPPCLGSPWPSPAAPPGLSSPIGWARSGRRAGGGSSTTR